MARSRRKQAERLRASEFLVVSRAMPGFPKPKGFSYSFNVATEVEHLRAQKKTRKVPARHSDKLLVATWNIANLGAPDQVREPECFDLIAEIVSWFDSVAVQEVRDNADPSESDRQPWP